MERPLIGSVVVVEFPYSGFEGAKKRPAFCIAHSGSKDIILCQITSQNYHKEESVIPITAHHFSKGQLPIEESFIRPDKIFTFESDKILRVAGTLNHSTILKVGEKLREIFSTVLDPA